MSGEITCDEEGSCKLLIDYNPVIDESLPSDLIMMDVQPTSKPTEKKLRKNIKGSSGHRQVSTNSQSQKRGRKLKQLNHKIKKVKRVKKLVSKKQKGQSKKKTRSISRHRILKPKKESKKRDKKWRG